MPPENKKARFHWAICQENRPKIGRGGSTNFKPGTAIDPFAGPFLGPVEPVFLDAGRLVGWVA